MFYVYEWYNIETNEVFYVGKGINNRYKHLRKRNKLFLDYINKNKCNVRIIKYFKEEQDAFNYEHKRICELKEKNECSCNLDYGGKGGCHFIWTPEMREYYSKYNVMKSQKQRERMSKNNPMKNPEIAKKTNSQKRKHPIINGKYYETVEEASKDNNVCICTIRTWCKIGVNPLNQKCHWSNEPEKDIEYEDNSGKKMIYDGTIYKSVKEFRNKIGISHSTSTNWLKKGFDTNGKVCRYLDDDRNLEFKLPKISSSKPITINGKHYLSVTAAAIDLGISDRTLHHHIKHNTGKYNYKYDNQ
jgi:hypothetical protein